MGVNLRQWAYPGGIPTPPSNTPVVQPNFIPGFEKATIKSLINGSEIPINGPYFVDEATAVYLKNKFGASEIILKPFNGHGGSWVCDKQTRWLKWDDGIEINAGMLADYYVRGPEKDFPGWAEMGIWDTLGRARREREASE